MAIDYKSFTSNGELSLSPLNKKWWEEEEMGDLAASIFGVVKYLQSNQTLRTTNLITTTRLYGNLSLMGLNGLTYSKLASVTNASASRITYNVCQSTVDAITSKIAKNKPKPLFLTSGGDYKLQRKAEKLTKFVDGIFYENDAHRLGTEIFRDASIWGTGCLYVFERDGRIKFERVIISEIQVDEVEAFYGHPRSLYRVKTVDRGVLHNMFDDILEGNKDAINESNSAKPDDLGGKPTVSDEVAICEAWHLPSGPDAEDGRHVICVDKHVLFEEKYEKHYFPFVFFHWSKKLFGFWGQGLVEQIQNIQLEINKLLWVVQRSMHLAGSFKILLENGSKIVKEHLNNDVGAILNYTGTKPEYVTPPIVPPEIYTHLATLKNAAYEQAGISQLSAASQKPEGLDSGAALREYNDIESDRFMTVGQAYERFYVELAQVVVSIAKTVYGGGSYKVKVPGKGFIETIDWKDVHMHEDAYVLKCYPVSALPNEPAGRLQTIQELMQAGLIDPESGRRLLDYPDLEEEEGLNNAPQDYLHEILDKMVDDGEYTPPEPFDDLQRAHKLALNYYAKYKTQGLEEEKLDLFRRFMDQIQLLQQAAIPPAPSQAPTQPQAAPQPQPQSALVPNQPGVAQ
jgi:hypothetical protein